MKLNSELKSIFEPLNEFVNEYLVESGYEVDDQLDVYVKTPNLFYKKVVVYLKADFKTESLKDITSYLESRKQFGMKELKSSISQAYMNYFINYHTNFKDDFYEIIFRKENGKLKLFGVLESDSPDPIDEGGIQIRK